MVVMVLTLLEPGSSQNYRSKFLLLTMLFSLTLMYCCSPDCQYEVFFTDNNLLICMSGGSKGEIVQELGVEMISSRVPPGNTPTPPVCKLRTHQAPLVPDWRCCPPLALYMWPVQVPRPTTGYDVTWGGAAQVPWCGRIFNGSWWVPIFISRIHLYKEIQIMLDHATYSPPFAFFISNVLLDESFLVGVWVICRQEGWWWCWAGIHPYLCSWLL